MNVVKKIKKYSNLYSKFKPRFVVSKQSHPADTNYLALVREEFGNSFRLADWNDIR